MKQRLGGGYRKDSDSEPTSNEFQPSNESNEGVSWDVFQDPPRKPEIGSTASTEVIDKTVLILRGVTLAVTCTLVLGCAVLAKGTLLFMTSQIKKDTTRYYCKSLALDSTQQFTVTLPATERVAWIWMLIFAYFVPEIGKFIQAVRICAFKTVKKRPTKWEWMVMLFTECMPAVGFALLVFVVLPELDVVKGAMLTNGMCFVPGLVGFLSRNPKCHRSLLKMILDVASLVAQILAFVIWPLVEKKPVLYTIPASILLISVGWWENFVSVESPFFEKYATRKLKLMNKVFYMLRVIAPCKCIIFLITALIVIIVREGDAYFVFEKFGDALSAHNITIDEVIPVVGSGQVNFDDVVSTGYGSIELTKGMTPVWVFIIHVLATYICYAVGKFSCKILMQCFSYAFPINLTVPILLAGLIGMCGAYSVDVCAFDGTIPSYLFFNVPSIYFFSDFIVNECSWIWLVWLLSQTWITIHIWNPSPADKLGSTGLLFFKPLYDPYLIDQSLALNRRRNHPDNTHVSNSDVDEVEKVTEDHTTRIYACGTMWHETKEEMMEFLKSVMRLDQDQFNQKKIKHFLEKENPNYYEIEINIFFDDAFVRQSQTDNDPLLNSYVLDLIDAVNDAAKEVHKIEDLKLAPPEKIPTPYGGRLIWTLMGGNKMVAHLKDKAKIRAKKRWSQVMYMYYLLGHRLIERSDLTPNQKQIRASNTYILALDGDIDFQPNAVHLLVDHMKKNPSLGAACGRIHPIGEGAMAWYQIFEYAVGHWLQKATEHVIGCVLCSPGCFSLFRGMALMDNSVMKKYTTVATEPIHYVQYDQGEDRWLCTLLLQQGYRVEYSAASDSYTHCPEGFNEFYNQRRRWMPSTTANIIDLLNDAKHTAKVNDNISRIYILYQTIMLIGTVLGPGTIFLMLVGSFVAAFKFAQWTSFGLNLVPILIFVIVCATCKSDTQLFIAGVLSSLYGLVMMAVLLGVLIQIKDDGWLAPSSLFFFVMAAEFVITAIMHPSEFYCLKYGVIYYVTVPSMYMLLVIYSVFNMNNVSWGTREVTVVKKDNDANPGKPQGQKTRAQKMFSYFGADPSETEGSLEFSCAGLFRILCCTHKAKDNEHLIKIQLTLENLNKKIDSLERMQYDGVENQPRKTVNRRATFVEGARASHRRSDRPSAKPEFQEEEEDEATLSDTSLDQPNSWFYDEGLEHSMVNFLKKEEENFWKELLDKYLHPIDETEKKAELEKKLKDLRDKVVFSFFMINSLFVIIVFLLTLQKETLHANWPFGAKYNFTYVTDRDEIQINVQYLELEPIGFVFLIFFALLLIIQFIAMMIHRFKTYTQIIANISFKDAMPNGFNDDITLEDALKIVQAASRLNQNEDDNTKVARRKTVIALNNKNKNEKIFTNMEDAFKMGWEENINSKNEFIRRKTKLFDQRRKTLKLSENTDSRKPMSLANPSVQFSENLIDDSTT